MLHSAAANTESLLTYFEAQAKQESGEAKRLTQKCIDWKRDDLRRIRALIPLALVKRDTESAAPLPGPEKPEPTNELREAIRDLLNWLPMCPKGSDGYLHRVRVEKALADSPTVQPRGPWSYTGDEDGDFVIWENGAFVANVGGSSFVPIPPTQAVNAFLSGAAAQTATPEDEELPDLDGDELVASRGEPSTEWRERHGCKCGMEGECHVG